MTGNESAFDKEYVRGTETDAGFQPSVSDTGQVAEYLTGTQTETGLAELPAERADIDAERYGISKPRRVVVRGRIIHGESEKGATG